MGPIASKVLGEIRKAKRGQVVDLQALRALRDLPAEVKDDLGVLPVHHAQWIVTFKLLAPLAHSLLGTHALRKAADSLASAEQEYEPGGPPLSPIFDSVFTTWSLADMPMGPQRETLCSVVAETGAALGLPVPLIAAARTLAASRFGVYAVRDLGSSRVELTDVITAQRITVHVPNDLRQRGRFWFTRLLPPLSGSSGDWVVWTTPYQLLDPRCEEAWRDYHERVAAGVPEPLRQRHIEMHYKAADKPRRWLDYIFYAYAGMTNEGAVVLLGVEDKPESLPQHPSFDPVAASDPTGEAAPLERVRLRLEHVADVAGFPREQASGPARELMLQAAQMVERSHRMYGQLDVTGASAVDLLARERDKLLEAERAELDALRDGWFSLFEIKRIKVDECMLVRDLLCKRELWVSERAATRHVQLGDVLFGWVTQHGDVTRLEGGLGHVPAGIAKPFIAGVRRKRSALARSRPELDWKKQHGLLALPALELLARLFAEAPRPGLVNASGHDVVFSRAHYHVIDRTRVHGLLQRTFDAGPEEGVFCMLDGKSLAATLVLQRSELEVQCDSRERLQALKQRLRWLCGDSLKHRADSFEDPTTSKSRAPSARQRIARPASELPAELAKEVQAMLLAHMRTWVDQPIPMLGGKTPRQAARTERGRDVVTHMLIQQQQRFDKGEDLPAIDLTEIWHSLGLQPRT